MAPKKKPAAKKPAPAKSKSGKAPPTSTRTKAPVKAPIDERPAHEIEVIRQDTKALQAEAKRLSEIDTRFGDGQPYARERVINETRFFLAHSAETLLEAGKRLLLLKEHEPSGEFHRAVEEIGLAPRSAQKMMQAAAKFSGERKALANLGKAKMLELVAEDDDDLDALADGGTLAGHNLDEIERMTAHELRATLRRERHKHTQENETHEQLLAGKNRKLDELAKQLNERATAEPWPREVAGLKNDLHDLGVVLDEVLGKHLTVIDATELGMGPHAPDTPAYIGYKTVIHNIGEQIERLCTLAANLRFEYDTRLGGFVAADKGHILPEPETAE